ncbi:MAG: hypothetical protein ABEI77_05405 [Halorientalis sp.]
MKSGASDPFADDESTAETVETDTDESDASAESDDADTVESQTAGSETQASTGQAAATATETASPNLSREELPFILRREKVKDERPEVHQLFVQDGTHERAVEAERELEAMLDVDLSRTDAREAIYLAGMQHLDDAAAVLRRWGYDM